MFHPLLSLLYVPGGFLSLSHPPHRTRHPAFSEGKNVTGPAQGVMGSFPRPARRKSRGLSPQVAPGLREGPCKTQHVSHWPPASHRLRPGRGEGQQLGGRPLTGARKRPRMARFLPTDPWRRKSRRRHPLAWGPGLGGCQSGPSGA